MLIWQPVIPRSSAPHNIYIYVCVCVSVCVCVCVCVLMQKKKKNQQIDDSLEAVSSD